jgi:hypothetical protein
VRRVLRHDAGGFSSNISSAAGSLIFIIAPPVYETHYYAKQCAVRKESYPGSGGAEVLPERLAFIAQKKESDRLHDNRERTAGENDSVDQ